MIWGLGLRILGLSSFWGFGFRILGLWDLGFRVEDFVAFEFLGIWV